VPRGREGGEDGVRDTEGEKEDTEEEGAVKDIDGGRGRGGRMG